MFIICSSDDLAMFTTFYSVNYFPFKHHETKGYMLAEQTGASISGHEVKVKPEYDEAEWDKRFPDNGKRVSNIKTILYFTQTLL